MSKESQKRLVGMIRGVALFSGLNDKHLKGIANSGKEMSYKEGRTIVKEGEDGIGFYLVLDGKVEVRKGAKVLSNMGAGDFFGEMSLLDGKPRSADVVAVAPTVCFGMTSWSFTALVKANPDIAVNMMKVLVARLRGTSNALTE